MTTSHEFWTDRLSAYLDSELAPEEAKALEDHLADCAGCTTVLDELREVARRARALPGIEPGNELWQVIEGRLGEDPLAEAVIPLRAGVTASAGGSRAVRRFSLGLPQAMAAGLVLLAGGWLAGSSLAVRPGTDTLGAGAGEVHLVEAAGVIPGGLADEVVRLQEAVLSRSGSLDEATRARVLRNLQVIDRAIGESLRALEVDGESEYLRDHLGETVERKRSYLLQLTRLLEA